MKNIIIIFSLILLSLKCFSQEQQTFETLFSSELSTDTDLLPILDMYDVDNKTTYPIPSNSKYNFRVRIFSNKSNTSKIIVSNKTGYEINKANKSPFLNLSQILYDSLKFDVQPNSTNQSFTWEPGSGSAKDKLARFKSLLAKNNLSLEINYDPKMFFCIENNSIINITIHYEFSLNPSAQVELEQKSTTFECLIDNEGVISLPILFESIGSNVNGEGGNISNVPNWFDAIDNCYRLKIADSKLCGRERCTTYYQVEKLITTFYLDKLNGKSQISNIKVIIKPDNRLTSIFVNYKGKTYILPYRKLPIDDFLSDELILKSLGKRCKRIKGTVFTRCNILKYATNSDFSFKTTSTYKPPFRTLLPGDIIYIK